MAAVCRSYASHAEALEAVESALAAGIAGDDVLVLTGEPIADGRGAPVGSFAGTLEHDVPVASFAGTAHAHDAGMGTFAGAPGRAGSFGDAAREVVTAYPDGVERMHAAGRSHVLRLLQRAGLDEPTSRRDVDALHAGRVLVLVEHADGEAARVTGALDG